MPCYPAPILVIQPHPCHPSSPKLSSRAQSRDLLCAFLLPQISTELRHRTRRGTILSAGMAGESLLAAKRLLLSLTFLCPSDAGARVEICGGRRAQSRSLDCARDDKTGRLKGKSRGTERQG